MHVNNTACTKICYSKTTKHQMMLANTFTLDLSDKIIANYILSFNIQFIWNVTLYSVKKMIYLQCTNVGPLCEDILVLVT